MRAHTSSLTLVFMPACGFCRASFARDIVLPFLQSMIEPAPASAVNYRAGGTGGLRVWRECGGC